MIAKKSNTPPLHPNSFYHIYNRGINGCSIFTQDANYHYFLKKYALYIPPIAHTYAYCLLGNHFHFLVGTRTEAEIAKFQLSKPEGISTNEVLASTIISRQFSHLFNAYAQAFNKATHRTGNLFETPFRRKPVDSNRYFTGVVAYIHQNPQKHGIVSDFRDYPHSSYQSIISNKPTALERNTVITWFNNNTNYVTYHKDNWIISEAQPWDIEVD